MAHGVLHRVQQQVRACPQTGSLRARVPPRSFETAQRRAVEGITGSSPRLLQPLTGTQRLARAALRGRRDVCCCVPLWMRLLLNEAG